MIPAHRILAICLAAALAGCGEKPPGAATPAVPVAAATDTTVEEVRSVLTRYFKVWSDKDMAAYEALFDPGATIHFVQEGGQVVPWPVPPFIEAQRQAHAAATAPMVETAERMEIHVSPDGRAAQAAVKWRLLDGTEVTIGWDHFTLLRQEKGWRILNLVFYKE